MSTLCTCGSKQGAGVIMWPEASAHWSRPCWVTWKQQPAAWKCQLDVVCMPFRGKCYSSISIFTKECWKYVKKCSIIYSLSNITSLETVKCNFHSLTVDKYTNPKINKKIHIKMKEILIFFIDMPRVQFQTLVLWTACCSSLLSPGGQCHKQPVCGLSMAQSQ